MLTNPTGISFVSTSASTGTLNFISPDDYKETCTLGKGVYGEVVLLEHRRTGQKYVLKKRRKEIIAMDPKWVEHVNNERDILSLLSGSPFVIRLIDSAQDAHYLYLLMEYAECGSLSHMLKTSWDWTRERIQLYIAEVVVALFFIHSRNIVYGGLKIENVLVGADGHVLLADFSLAEIIPGTKDITCSTCGTSLNPALEERNSNNESGHRLAADLYSLGVLIYVILFGQDPLSLKKFHSFPHCADSTTDDLIALLCHPDPEKRPGIRQVMSHEWFNGIVWDRMIRSQVMPHFVAPEMDVSRESPKHVEMLS